MTQELRQKSARRFQYLVAIDRAIVERPLPKLGRAWSRGEVGISQARELIRTMTPGNEDEWLERAASSSVWRLQRLVREAGRPDARTEEMGRPPEAQGGPGGEEEPWRLTRFSATRPVDGAWQVCLETSRRLAGFDLPVHECVEDLLAEYAAGCSVSPVEVGAVEPAEGAPADPDVEMERAADAARWRRGAQLTEEAWRELSYLRRIGGRARLAADPLEGLEPGRPCRGAADGSVSIGPAAPALDPADLHRRIRWLLRLEANLAWHECVLIRLVADLRLHQRLGCRSLRQYATELLGSGDRSPWSLVALARKLDRLPKVAAAFRSGKVTALEAAEICRVASGRTQDAWVRRARSSTLRDLREAVEFVLAVEEASGLPPQRPLPADRHPSAEPTADRWWGCVPDRGGRPPRVQTCAPRTSAVVAVPLARRVEGWYSAFGEDPAAVFRALLDGRGPKRPVSFLAPESTAAQWDVTLADCRSRHACHGDGPRLNESQCVAILLLNFLDQWAGPESLKESRAHRVFTRDGWRCQVPRCRSRARLNAHHVVFRSRNGPDDGWNLVTVCREHHGMLHSGAIRVRGRAPGRLEWWMGVNTGGDVRERFINGVRVACDPLWSASGPSPRTRSGADWRPAPDVSQGA